MRRCHPGARLGSGGSSREGRRKPAEGASGPSTRSDGGVRPCARCSCRGSNGDCARVGQILDVGARSPFAVAVARSGSRSAGGLAADELTTQPKPGVDRPRRSVETCAARLPKGGRLPFFASLEQSARFRRHAEILEAIRDYHLVVDGRSHLRVVQNAETAFWSATNIRMIGGDRGSEFISR